MPSPAHPGAAGASGGTTPLFRLVALFAVCFFASSFFFSFFDSSDDPRSSFICVKDKRSAKSSRDESGKKLVCPSDDEPKDDDDDDDDKTKAKGDDDEKEAEAAPCAKRDGPSSLSSSSFTSNSVATWISEASFTRRNTRMRTQTGLRIAVITLNSPGSHSYHRRSSVWMWPYTVHNHIEYAKRNGYDIHIEGSEVVDTATPPSWSKIKLIRKYLLDYDYVLWADVDVLFVTMDKKLEEIIEQHKPTEHESPGSADVIMAKDFNGLNCGVMLWKRTPWSIEFLDRIWHFDGDRGNVWQEQFAIMETLKRSHQDAQHFRFIAQREINAYTFNAQHQNAQWRSGDLLVHFANCDGRPHTCWEEFQYYQKQAEKTNGFTLSEEDMKSVPMKFHTS